MTEKIQKFMLDNGFDFMDSWQDETTGTVKENYRKKTRDITIEYIKITIIYNNMQNKHQKTEEEALTIRY